MGAHFALGPYLDPLVLMIFKNVPMFEWNRTIQNQIIEFSSLNTYFWAKLFLPLAVSFFEKKLNLSFLLTGIITEALLPTFNVAKAQIAKELASKNCYIKNIESLETLGTTTIICTNKTGVITQNRMIVGQMWLDNTLHQSYEFIRDFKSKSP